MTVVESKLFSKLKGNTTKHVCTKKLNKLNLILHYKVEEGTAKAL